MPQTQQVFDTIKGFGAFSQIIAKGYKLEKKPLRIFIRKTASEQSKIRIGFAISRQIRTAVERNRLKRLLREAIKKEEKQLLKCASPNEILEIIILYAGNREIAPKRVRFFSLHQTVTELLKKIYTETK